MSGIFDPAIFDPAIFDAGGGRAHPEPDRRLEGRLRQIEDDAEALLLLTP
ncbi:MAG: hypothetical protein ACXU95_08130 [Isosphaeraceae bacterium]